MSAISEKVRAALYTKLNVSGVTSLGASVFHRVAPENADLPVLLFSRYAMKPVTYAFGPTLINEDDLWLVKSITDENSSTTKTPSELAQDILEAAETAIGTTLTLSGSTTWWVKRERDIPDYTETLNDRLIYHHGFLLRVVTA